MKIDRKQINKIFRRLKREIKKSVFVATSYSYNFEIAQYFKDHPRGIGVTLQSFKPIKVSGSMTQEVIALFSSPAPAIIALGPNGSKSGYYYPYDKSGGTYISFADEPNLKAWADKNISGLDPKAKGLRIGKIGNTRFGRADNQWHTISGENMKRRTTTRDNILREVSKIKFKF